MTVAKQDRIAELDVIVVDVGNPHAVVIGDPDDLPRVGPLLETHERFPNGTNVQVARIDGRGEVTARVWERGVGETQSRERAPSPSPRPLTARATCSSTFPAVISACASPGVVPRSQDKRSVSKLPLRLRPGAARPSPAASSAR